MLTVDAPVFVIGTGRCGSTALMDLIAYHESFAWPSQYTSRWPGGGRAAILSRIVELPPFRSRLKFARYVPKHAESYELWNRSFPGFSEPFRDLVSDDVTHRTRESIRRTVSDIVRHQGKERFVTKYTGWSRIDFIRAIFPDAKFIHLVRDGRAVAYSYTTVPWWDGWGGVQRTRWGWPADGLRDELARYGDSFIVLAALQWRTLLNNILEKSRALPASDVLTLRYEDVVRAPMEAAYRCLVFAGVDEKSGRYAKHLAVAVSRIVDPQTEDLPPPWRRNLDRRQISMIQDACGEELARFHYE